MAHVRREPFRLQCFAYEGRRLFFVFNNQNSHVNAFDRLLSQDHSLPGKLHPAESKLPAFSLRSGLLDRMLHFQQILVGFLKGIAIHLVHCVRRQLLNHGDPFLDQWQI